MNILVTTLSNFDIRKMQRYTYTNDGEMLTGMFSSEAPGKYLVRELHEEQHVWFEKVIVFSTNACKAVNNCPDFTSREYAGEFLNPDGKTTEKYYRDTLLSYMKSLDKDSFKERFKDKRTQNKIFRFLNIDKLKREHILQKLEDDIPNPYDAYIYIDFTGGFRTAALASLMTIRFLEAKGFMVKKVVYASLFPRTTKGEIIDITKIYRTFDGVIANEHKAGMEIGRVEEDYEIESAKYFSSVYSKYAVNAKGKPEAYTGSKPFIFLSYSHKDEDHALALVKHLRSKHYRLWYDDGIRTGTDWEKTLDDKANSCSFCIILASRAYIKSTWCRKELKWISARKEVPILVIYLEDVVLKGRDFSKNQSISRRSLTDLDNYRKIFETEGLSEFEGDFE